MAVYDCTGHAEGSSALESSFVRTMLFSGRAKGQSTVVDGTTLFGAGLAEGLGSLTVSVVRSRSLACAFQGASQLGLRIPEPVQGFGDLAGFAEVSTGITRAVCPVCSVPQFRLGYTFGPEDLVLSLGGPDGAPFGAVSVTYTLYQVLGNGSVRQVGPETRIPGMSSLGCYYVTGVAGEGGQPGCWMVRFRHHESLDSPVTQKDIRFRVVDAVLSPLPGDTLDRKCKCGWD